ncbi:unnamed protein product, partial [Symbiodinium microadriaticum]
CYLEPDSPSSTKAMVTPCVQEEREEKDQPRRKQGKENKAERQSQEERAEKGRTVEASLARRWDYDSSSLVAPAGRCQEDSRSVQERARGAARMFILRAGCPASVDPGMADATLAQVITKKIPQLQGLLLQHGILTPFEHPSASDRISFGMMTDMWTEHCIVSHVPARMRWQIYVVFFGDSFEEFFHAQVFRACVLEFRRPRQHILADSSSSAGLPCATMCSCWYFLRKGHCPHGYYIQERLAIRMFGEIPLPSAAHAPATFKDDGDASSVEAAGRVRKPRSTSEKVASAKSKAEAVVGKKVAVAEASFTEVAAVMLDKTFAVAGDMDELQQRDSLNPVRLTEEIRHDDGLFMNWRPAGAADPADARRRGFNV